MPTAEQDRGRTRTPLGRRRAHDFSPPWGWGRRIGDVRREAAAPAEIADPPGLGGSAGAPAGSSAAAAGSSARRAAGGQPGAGPPPSGGAPPEAASAVQPGSPPRQQTAGSGGSGPRSQSSSGSSGSSGSQPSGHSRRSGRGPGRRRRRRRLRRFPSPRSARGPPRSRSWRGPRRSCSRRSGRGWGRSRSPGSPPAGRRAASGPPGRSMSPSERRRVRAQCLIKRRQLCRFFARNACQKGVFCIWAHGEAELELAPPPSGPCAWKTKLCSHYVEGWCAQGKLCPFAHGSDELRKDPKDRSPQRSQQTAAWLGRRPDLDAAVMMVADSERPQQLTDAERPEELTDVRPSAKKRAAPAAPGRGRRSPSRQNLGSRSTSASSRPASSPARASAAAPAPAAAAAAAAPAPGASAEPGGARRQAVHVSGCSDRTTACGVHGEYEVCGVNHDRPAFKSVDCGQGFESFIYYWDDRDGPDFAGWWIGPSLGGQDVWVRHPGSPSDRWPPRTGWFAPHDGPLDPGMVVESAALPAGTPGLPALDNKPSAAAATRPPQQASAKADGVGRAPRPKSVEASKRPPKPEGGRAVKREDDGGARADGGGARARAESEAGRKRELVALESSLDAVHKESEDQMKRMLELQRSMQELQKSMEDRRDREEKIQKKMRSLVVVKAVES